MQSNISFNHENSTLNQPCNSSIYMYIHTYIHTYIIHYSYIHTYSVHTYIHTHIHYIHTYTHTYTHIHTYVSCRKRLCWCPRVHADPPQTGNTNPPLVLLYRLSVYLSVCRRSLNRKLRCLITLHQPQKG